MKKTLTVSIPHKLTQQEARQRLQSGFAEMKTKYAGKIADLQETWNGDRMEFKVVAAGQTITGRLEVLPEVVKVEADLPWLVAVFAEKFRPKIEEEGRKMLEKK